MENKGIKTILAVIMAIMALMTLSILGYSLAQHTGPLAKLAFRLDLLLAVICASISACLLIIDAVDAWFAPREPSDCSIDWPL